MKLSAAGCVVALMGMLRLVRASALLALACAAAVGQTKEFHRTVPLDPGGLVTVDNYKGSIRVMAWDRPEVQVDARIEEDSWFVPSSLDFAEVRMDTGVGRVDIKGVYDQWRTPFGLGGRPFFHYTIRVPRTARVRIDDYKSEIEVAGLAADLDVKTYKGTVEVSDLSGALRVDTYKGDVRADFARLGGISRVETYKGTIELEVPPGTGFDLRTDLNKKARLNSDFGVRSGAVNGGGPDLLLKSYKGSFRLLER